MQVRNEKARKYLMDMRKKRPMPFAEKFPNADQSALKLLQRLLAFDPKDRPSAEEVLLCLHKYLLFITPSYLIQYLLHLSSKNDQVIFISCTDLVYMVIRH